MKQIIIFLFMQKQEITDDEIIKIQYYVKMHAKKSIKCTKN